MAFPKVLVSSHMAKAIFMKAKLELIQNILFSYVVTKLFEYNLFEHLSKKLTRSHLADNSLDQLVRHLCLPPSTFKTF